MPDSDATKPKTAAKAKSASRRRTKSAAPPKPASSAKFQTATVSANSSIIMSKDEIMKMNEKFTGGLEAMMSDAQSKAQEAFEKSSVLFGDCGEFAKGNVEAVVQSGKILSEGLQDMSTNLVAEGRSAFEAASADIKGMGAAKSPTDLLQIQGEMVRKNFDMAVASGSKNLEAMLRIASEAMAPMSSRVAVAAEKVRQTAV